MWMLRVRELDRGHTLLSQSVRVNHVNKTILATISGEFDCL